MPKNQTIKSEQHLRRLRRLAVQIAGQLPEDLQDSCYVLEFAAKLAKMVDGGGEHPEKPVRPLNLVK